MRDVVHQCAVREGVSVLMDAEESRLQPAIHHLAVHHMMPLFNTTKPLIYNTNQMYLKVVPYSWFVLDLNDIFLCGVQRSLEALLVDIAAAKTKGFSYGAKMVNHLPLSYGF